MKRDKKDGTETGVKKLHDWLKRHKIEPSDAQKRLLALRSEKDRQYAHHEHNFSGKYIRIGVVGDNHFGNKWTDKPFLNAIYQEFAKAGVEAVYNVGDLTDGPWQRHKNVLEQYAHGLEAQVTDLTKNYPEIPRTKTFVIDGNHDGWYRKENGMSVGMELARRRKDIVYLGADEATIDIGKVRVMLSHPDDGSSYAYSYKPQKFVESLYKMGEEIPNLIFQGHYHKLFYMQFGGVHFWLTGTTEHQTPWMRGKKIAADLGAWIVDIQRNKQGGLTSISSRILPYNGKRPLLR